MYIAVIGSYNIDFSIHACNTVASDYEPKGYAVSLGRHALCHQAHMADLMHLAMPALVALKGQVSWGQVIQ